MTQHLAPASDTRLRGRTIDGSQDCTSISRDGFKIWTFFPSFFLFVTAQDVNFPFLLPPFVQHQDLDFPAFLPSHNRIKTHTNFFLSSFVQLPYSKFFSSFPSSFSFGLKALKFKISFLPYFFTSTSVFEISFFHSFPASFLPFSLPFAQSSFLLPSSGPASHQSVMPKRTWSLSSTFRGTS